MRMTHALRARHDAILVGIGTVLADDPALTVRLVEGKSPRPVILDARLRTPENCRLMLRKDSPPWIFCSPDASRERRERLERLGARVFATALAESKRVDLGALLRSLGSEGMASLMVEGGGQVLASFMRERLADEIVVTLGTLFLGGYNPFVAGGGLQGFGPPFRLSGMRVERFGEDIVVSGRPDWHEGRPDSPAGTGETL
jgi:3,4-dihydroxy 2-butanone 4-phosphate synthase/GTP cyclohydrolase II